MPANELPKTTETLYDVWARLAKREIERREQERIEVAIENRLATIGVAAGAGNA